MIKRTLCMMALGMALTACGQTAENNTNNTNNTNNAMVMNPYDKSDAAVVMQGLEVYSDAGNGCGGCHGATGVEQPLASATNLSMSGPKSDEYLFNAIKKGVSGTAMSAYPGITDDDTWKIVTWIRSIEM